MESPMPKVFDVNGEQLEIDTPVTLLNTVDSVPAGTFLIIRDIGIAGAEQTSIELICQDDRNGGRVFVEPSNVQLISY